MAKELTAEQQERLNQEGISVLKGITLSALSAKGKKFSTGSVGWFLSGKVLVNDARYQFTGNATIIKSKGTEQDAPADSLLDNAAVQGYGKVFSTGSAGYFISGKAVIANTMVQISGNLVKIGSKPKATEAEQAAALVPSAPVITSTEPALTQEEEVAAVLKAARKGKKVA